MNTGYTIRKATREDVDIVREVCMRTFTDTFEKDNRAEDMALYLNENFSRGQILYALEDPSTTFWLAYDGNELIGYFKMRVGKKPDALIADYPIELERIYVIKKYIGKQVGQFLIDVCQHHARINNHDVMWLGVWEHNLSAISFYQKHGFEKFATHPFKLGTDLQTDLLMKKKL